MDIAIHTKVFCSDGLIGKSTHIIVDLVSEQVTHVVIKTKENGHEYLVPLDKVSVANREAILLDLTKDEIGNLPLFRETYFHGYDSYGGTPPVPSAGMGASFTRYHPYRTAETGAEEASEPHPSVQLAINKGAVVMATDDHVGVVDELVIEPDTHRVTHLVIRKHDLIKKKVVTVPVSEIERVEMKSVFLKITKAEVASLPTVTLKKYPWE